MYETLFTKIRTTLESVSLVKEIFCDGRSVIGKFPAVFFKPSGFDNNYETNTENRKLYRFTVLVIVGAGKDKPSSDILATVLPKVVDGVVAAFDAQWDQGTLIDGHRCWWNLASSEAWETSDEQTGIVAYAPMTLEVTFLKNI